MEYVSAKFRSDELFCKDAPSGQLPYTATAEQVATKVEGIDEAGEDCRQRLNRVRMKIEITEEVIAAMNERNGKKKDD